MDTSLSNAALALGFLPRIRHRDLAKLDLRLNETKSRIVDVTQGEALRFLELYLSPAPLAARSGVVQKTPAIKQRTALLRKLEEGSGAGSLADGAGDPDNHPDPVWG